MPKKMLLADDSITIQRVVSITFANEDVTITTVDNGDDAIIKAKEIKPDIILADVIMPKKNGYEVCQAIRNDPELRHIPVLLLAGTFEAFDENRAREVGASGHITKPFESQALIDKVNELLGVAPKPAPGPVAMPRPAPAAQPFSTPPATTPPFAARPTGPQPVQPKPVQPQSQPLQPRPLAPQPQQPMPSPAQPVQPQPLQPRPIQPQPLQPKPISPRPIPQPLQPKPTPVQPTQPQPQPPKPVQPQPLQARPVTPTPTPQPLQPRPAPVAPTAQPQPMQAQPAQPQPSPFASSPPSFAIPVEPPPQFQAEEDFQVDVFSGSAAAEEVSKPGSIPLTPESIKPLEGTEPIFGKEPTFETETPPGGIPEFQVVPEEKPPVLEDSAFATSIEESKAAAEHMAAEAVFKTVESPEIATAKTPETIETGEELPPVEIEEDNLETSQAQEKEPLQLAPAHEFIPEVEKTQTEAIPLEEVKTSPSIPALSKEEITQLAREAIEKVVWEVVPKLAEAILREEIDKLVEEKLKD